MPIQPKNPPRSPHFALFTLLLPGLPQLLFGQVQKGLVLMGVYVVCAIWAGPLLMLAVWVVALVDAYKVGYALADMTPVGEWAWFP